MKRLISPLLALLLVAALAAGAVAATYSDGALTWLESQVLGNGGLSDGFSEGASVGATTEAVFAATAAGEDLSLWGDFASPLDYLVTNAASARGPGTLAKLALVAVATGQDPRAFGGVDLLDALAKSYDPASGLWGGTVTEHAYAMLALHNAGEAIPAAATAALRGLQAADGGWAFDGTSQSDTNTSALAIQALVAAGGQEEGVTKALAFLRSQQNEDGGFPYQTPSDFGTESDANSTAWGIQALQAAGQSLADWNNPDRFLASLQGADGSFQWKKEVAGANFLATAQAVPALEGVSYVALPVVPAADDPSVIDLSGEPSATEEAPATLPDTGDARPWALLLVLGALALAGGVARRSAA